MSDTPETDKHSFSFAVAVKNCPPDDFRMVGKAFAQQLERERNEARRLLDVVQLELTGAIKEEYEARRIAEKHAPDECPWMNED